jgi:PKD repeat protein
VTRALVIATGCGGNTACPNGTTLNFTLKPQPSGGIPPAFTDPGFIVEDCDSVTWDFGDGSLPVTFIGSNTASHAFAAPANYTIKATAQNPLGTTTFSTNFAIASNPTRIGFQHPAGTIAAVFVAHENDPSVTLTVVRTLDMTRTVSGTIEGMGGDATEAVPAVGKSLTTITFAPNETVKTFSVPIVNDSAYESDRYYEFRFRVGTGGVIFDTTGYVQVVDDEPQPTISAASVRVPEGDGGETLTTIGVPVTLSAPLGIDYTVSASPQPGTAVAGDFDPTPVSVVIPAGQLATAIPVSIAGNSSVEPDKQFTVSLVPAGVAWEPRFVNSTATVTIVNDDASLSPPFLALGNGETVTLHLDIGFPFDAPKRIVFTSSAPDIVAAPLPIVLPAGVSGADIPISAKGATATGFAQINAIVPAHTTTGVTVTTQSALVVSPLSLNILGGQEAPVTLTMVPPTEESQPASVEPNNADIASVTPTEVVIPRGGSATVMVRGLRSGSTYLFAGVPNGAPIFITVRVGDGSPLISSVSPASGPPAGGTRVTLLGDNLLPACAVTFGEALATDLAAVPGGLAVTTPPHIPGAVDVTVRCGSAGGTAAGAFTYLRPKPRAAR